MRGSLAALVLAAVTISGCAETTPADTTPLSATTSAASSAATSPAPTTAATTTASTVPPPVTTMVPAGGTLSTVDLGATPVDVAGIPTDDAAINWTWFNDHAIVENATLTGLISSVVDSDIGGGPFNLEFDERLFYEFESPLSRDEIVGRLQQAMAPDLQWAPDVAAGEGALVARDGDRSTFAHEFGIRVNEVDGHWEVATSFTRLVPADSFPPIPYFGNIDDVWGAIAPVLPGTVTPSGFWANVRFDDDRILMGYDMFLFVDRTVAQLTDHARAEGWTLVQDSPELFATDSLGTFQFIEVGPETTQVIVYGWTSELPIQRQA